MTPPPSKLVLPTVLTCRWRHAPAADAPAECGLAASLLGDAAGGPVEVSGETCAACCRSFPPSPRRLNSVVAGVLRGAAVRALDRRGWVGPGVEAAARARDLAEAALDVDLPARFRLTPARDLLPCAWRGEPEPAGDPGATEGEPLHRCEHADHDLASPSRCRMCRDWARRRPISRWMAPGELVPPPGRRSGRLVRDWAVGVTTAPRRRATLEACLDGVARAGWGAPRLFLDGAVRVPPRHAHLPTTWREEGIGAWPSWYLALAELLVQRPDADAYFLLQDDVALHDRDPLRPYLEQVLWPGDRPGLVFLYQSGPGTVPGWRPAADSRHLSAQAVLFPPDLARDLVADPRVVRSVLASSADRHTPIPEAVLDWAHRRAASCWYPTPSLAQHFGNASAIWEGAALTSGRRAAWFSGDLEDAFAAEGDLADFPEDGFPCAAPHLDGYRRQGDRGRGRMRSSSVVVCGVCRDVRHHLPRLAARVERLGAMFGEYRVVVVAPPSADRTRGFLDDWRAANPRVMVLDGPPAPRPGWCGRAAARASWLARCRDRYREHVAADVADPEHAIVVDADTPGGWSYDGIAHTFGADDWDFVGSLGLALGPPAADGPARWLPHCRGGRRPADDASEIPGRGGPLVPVETCFGGLGIYRMACFRAAAYQAIGDSEHAGFHARLRRSGLGRLFLNPSQIVLHSPA